MTTEAEPLSKHDHVGSLLIMRIDLYSKDSKDVEVKASEPASRGSAWVWSNYLAAVRAT